MIELACSPTKITLHDLLGDLTTRLDEESFFFEDKKSKKDPVIIHVLCDTEEELVGFEIQIGGHIYYVYRNRRRKITVYQKSIKPKTLEHLSFSIKICILAARVIQEKIPLQEFVRPYKEFLERRKTRRRKHGER